MGKTPDIVYFCETMKPTAALISGRPRRRLLLDGRTQGPAQHGQDPPEQEVREQPVLPGPRRPHAVLQEQVRGDQVRRVQGPRVPPQVLPHVRPQRQELQEGDRRRRGRRGRRFRPLRLSIAHQSVWGEHR